MNALINPELWEKSGGLLGLIMFALFVLLAFDRYLLVKKIDDMRLQIERNKNQIVKCFYDANLLEDRRRNRQRDEVKPTSPEPNAH